ncbi:MAG: hypothetical protein AAF975_09640, partial [Spirochaetota bacterium]
ESFHFFDPRENLWRQTAPQSLTFRIVNLGNQADYSDIEKLHFGKDTVASLNIMFWLQSYIFYICLIIFLFLVLSMLPQIIAVSDAKREALLAPLKSFPHDKLLFWFRTPLRKRLVLLLFSTALVWLPYRISSARNRTFLEKTRQHYLRVVSSREQGAASENIDWAYLEEKLQTWPHSAGDLPNIALLFYQNGLPLLGLEVAYLNYSQLPLHPVSRRLLLSLRIQQGLDPALPDFFFWPLQLRGLGRFFTAGLFLAFSIYCLRQRRRWGVVRHIFRNYFLVSVVLLLGLSARLEDSALAVNTYAALQLSPIPYSASEGRRNSWDNRLNAGELVKIKGRYISGNQVLVMGEKQDQ